MFFFPATFFPLSVFPSGSSEENYQPANCAKKVPCAYTITPTKGRFGTAQYLDPEREHPFKPTTNSSKNFGLQRNAAAFLNPNQL